VDGLRPVSGQPENRQAPGRILALIVGLSFILHIVMTLKRSTLQFDEIEYVRMAENLGAGRVPLDVTGLTSTHFTALLPLCIAAARMVLRDYVLSAYVVVTVFWSLITVPTYLLGRGLANQKVGLMAAALVAVAPAFVVNQEYVYSESLFIFFLLFAVVFGRHMFRGCRVPCSTLAGASLGLAYLANPAALYYVFIFAAIAVGVSLKRGVWSHMLRAFGIFLFFFTIFALPYVIFLHSELGKWTYTGKTAAGPIYAATNRLADKPLQEGDAQLGALTEDGRDILLLKMEGDTSSSDPVNFILHNPKQALKNFAGQLTAFHNDVLGTLIPLTLLPLLGLGLFASGWTRRGATGVGYLLLMMGPAVLDLMLLAYPRYFLVFVPMAMVWVALGWSRLEAWGSESVELSLDDGGASRYRRWVPWVVGVLVLLPPLAQTAYNGINEQFPVQYKEAGEWLKAETGGGARVMNNAASAYYAGGTLVVFPYADYGRTTAYARYQGVDYLVIDLSYIDTRPELARLLGAAGEHPEWRLVDQVRPDTPDEVLIFHLEKADTGDEGPGLNP